MKKLPLIIEVSHGNLAINGRNLEQILASPEAKMANRSEDIPEIFELLVKHQNIVVALGYMREIGIGPIIQITLLRALTGWTLDDAIMEFNSKR